MSKYLCWNCGLWQGDEQDLEIPSQLCPSCKKAFETSTRPRGAFAAPYPEEAEDA